MDVLITGSQGFIGSNLAAWVRRMPDHQALEFDKDNTQQDLGRALFEAQCVVHLAGANRPESDEEFTADNVDLTARICGSLAAAGRAVPIVFASSTQAELENPYGISKRRAEEVLKDYSKQTGAAVVVYRLTNVFGKWCRPNYNSVVATFCHNIAHDLPITISDPAAEVALIHVDDVVGSLLATADELTNVQTGPAEDSFSYREAGPIHTVTLGRLAERIRSFRRSRETLQAPAVSDPFTWKLYGTYLSYLDAGDFAYDLPKRSDARGDLAEFIKSAGFGQIFVSRTAPGITRGNHYHHNKAEKFLVLEGEAIIRFRPLRGGPVVEYPVRGEEFRVVDIPTGYTHSIENVGDRELITLFWASEIFDPERPDTFSEDVLP